MSCKNFQINLLSMHTYLMREVEAMYKLREAVSQVEGSATNKL